MWCCASKPEVKKVLRSAKQQPLQKVTLNLPPTIKLEYRKKWQGKIQQSQGEKRAVQEVVQKPKPNAGKVAALKKKLEEYRLKKKELEEDLSGEVQKGKELQRGLQKGEGMATVVEYMIVREEQKIDSFVLKIKA